MKQISSLLAAVVLLCSGGCGQESAEIQSSAAQESAEVQHFKATKIKAEQGDASAQFWLG